MPLSRFQRHVSDRLGTPHPNVVLAVIRAATKNKKERFLAMKFAGIKTEQLEAVAELYYSKPKKAPLSSAAAAGEKSKKAAKKKGKR